MPCSYRNPDQTIDENVRAQIEIVKEMLDKLGATPEAIAAELQRLGCNGEPFDAETCPVANYLDRRGVIHPSASQEEIAWGTERDSFRLTPIAPLQQFITNFDALKYPELLALQEDSPAPAMAAASAAGGEARAL